MRVGIDYTVKFRAFGITFGTTSGSAHLFNTAIAFGEIYDGKVIVDDRGVKITLRVR